MRVIAGKFRSRNLQSLPGSDTRPTYDRLKETLFNVLQSAGVVEGARFLDLYAGTGSVGIEALSRGAASVVFVESNRKAVRVIETNLRSLGIRDEAMVISAETASVLADLSRGEDRFSVIFVDPPYAMQGEYERTLRLLDRSEMLDTGAVVVAEHDKRFDPGEQHGTLHRYRLLNQGESSLSFYKRA